MLENIEKNNTESNINPPVWEESSGTGVMSSLIFMAIMFVAMFIISNYMN